jgi:hypothetical protein
MKLAEGKIADLQDRDDRTIAQLAKQATIDTLFGGARALVLAKRLDRMGSPVNCEGVVGDVYSASTGRTPADYTATVCPECGTVVLGEETAIQHCGGY